MKPRIRLPIISAQVVSEDDPLLLLRGGRFARYFAGTLAVLGLAWVVSARVSALSLIHI